MPRFLPRNQFHQAVLDLIHKCHKSSLYLLAGISRVHAYYKVLNRKVTFCLPLELCSKWNSMCLYYNPCIWTVIYRYFFPLVASSQCVCKIDTGYISVKKNDINYYIWQLQFVSWFNLDSHRVPHHLAGVSLKYQTKVPYNSILPM